VDFILKVKLFSRDGITMPVEKIASTLSWDSATTAIIAIVYLGRG
jgi:hypothetical protein